MTSIHKFKATFKDLAAAMGLSYHDMKRGKLVVDLPRLQASDVSGFYYQETSIYGPQGGLCRIPKVMYEILRRTIVLSAVGNDNAIGWPFFEIIMAMMSGEAQSVGLDGEPNVRVQAGCACSFGVAAVHHGSGASHC
jgi:hypothetical protein